MVLMPSTAKNDYERSDKDQSTHYLRKRLLEMALLLYPSLKPHLFQHDYRLAVSR